MTEKKKEVAKKNRSYKKRRSEDGSKQKNHK